MHLHTATNLEGTVSNPDPIPTEASVGITIATGHEKQLSKQPSLEKPSATSILTNNSDPPQRNPSNGSINQNSIADLEKKLAALRNTENTEEARTQQFFFFIFYIHFYLFLTSLIFSLQQQRCQWFLNKLKR